VPFSGLKKLLSEYETAKFSLIVPEYYVLARYSAFEIQKTPIIGMVPYDFFETPCRPVGTKIMKLKNKE